MGQSCTDKKFIILKQDKKILSLLFHGSRLIRAGAEDEEGSLLGSVCIARVKDVAKNIHAAFVEIAPGTRCFLNLKEVRNPFLINRKYDGRLLAEDELLVQVSREAMGPKPPSVTCNISLDGKYCILSKERPGIAYSAKLSAKARHRIADGLKDCPDDLSQTMKSFGIVIRTNARELQGDFSPLMEEIRQLASDMHRLLETAPYRTCFSKLHEKQPSYLTGLRDMYEGLYEEIVTDEPEIYDKIQGFYQSNPQFTLPPIRLYQDTHLPLAKLYSVEARLKEALGRRVWLKSGGYLMIEPTEALTVIDVNSGKINTKNKADDTYFHINMEAAEEIALQLALRNLSGIIIVDFINMAQEQQRKKLMARLGDLLKKDAIKTTLIDITALGLVEITRMKTSSPLKEQLSTAPQKN